MKYLVELVITEPPYICLGFVKNTSLENNKLEFTDERNNALIVESESAMNKVFDLITIHNRDKVRVREWITEVGSKTRIFKNNLVW